MNWGMIAKRLEKALKMPAMIRPNMIDFVLKTMNGSMEQLIRL